MQIPLSSDGKQSVPNLWRVQDLCLTKPKELTPPVYVDNQLILLICAEHFLVHSAKTFWWDVHNTLKLAVTEEDWLSTASACCCEGSLNMLAGPHQRKMYYCLNSNL